MLNPYNPDKAVRDSSMFFGREIQIKRIIEGFSGSGECFVLYGGRRIGKTSLLREVERRLHDRLRTSASPRVIPIYVNLNLNVFQSRAAFFQTVTHKLAQAIQGQWGVSLDVARVGTGADPAEEFIRAFTAICQQVEHQVGSIRAGLLVDESEYVMLTEEETELQRREKTELRQNLRSILSDEEKTAESSAMLMTGSQRFRQAMMEKGSPLKNILTPILLHALAEEEAKDLICVPAQHRLSDEIIRRVLDQTGGHPHLIHYLMRELYHDVEKGELPTRNRVDQIAERYQEEKKDVLVGWWKEIGSLGREVYSLLSGGARLRQDEVRQHLDRKEGVKEALESLLYHGVIRQDSEEKYFASGEIFKAWSQGFKEQQIEGHEKIAQAVVLADIWGYSSFTNSQKKRARQILERAAREALHSNGASANFCELQQGDQICVTFDDTAPAVTFAHRLHRQLHLYRSKCQSGEVEIHARIAIHYDDVLLGAKGEPTSGAVDKAAHMLKPDQWDPPRYDLSRCDYIVFSDRVYEEVKHLPELRIISLGIFKLKNFPDRHVLYECKTDKLIINADERWIGYGKQRLDCEGKHTREFDALVLLLREAQKKGEPIYIGCKDIYKTIWQDLLAKKAEENDYPSEEELIKLAYDALKRTKSTLKELLHRLDIDPDVLMTRGRGASREYAATCGPGRAQLVIDEFFCDARRVLELAGKKDLIPSLRLCYKERQYQAPAVPALEVIVEDPDAPKYVKARSRVYLAACLEASGDREPAAGELKDISKDELDLLGERERELYSKLRKELL